MRRLIAGLILAVCCAAALADAVFYQPQNRDAGTPAQAWAEMFGTLKADGADTLIVQWTRFGDEQFGGADGWLDQAMRIAMDKDLVVIIGLYWDPEFFSWAGDKDDAVSARLDNYAQESLRLAERWQALTITPHFGGWYVPAELDDLNWRSPEKRRLLRAVLQTLQRRLRTGSSSPPLMITAFFGGHSGPSAFAQWLHEIGDSGWLVWLQDGSGVDHGMSALERRAYLAAASRCDAATRIGMVNEVFRQVSAPDQPFRARPATREELEAAALTTKGLCFVSSARFSLRYLPAAAGVLKHD